MGHPAAGATVPSASKLSGGRQPEIRIGNPIATMNILRLKQFVISSCFCTLIALFPTIAQTPGWAADATVKPGPDVLVFTNGDHLSGKLDHEADGTVFFTSDNAGTVQVKWDKLKELRTAEPFAVIENGVVVGRKQANPNVPIGDISVTDGTLTVTAGQGAHQIPVKNIAYLVDQPTFEKNVLHGQSLLQGITGSISAGLSAVSSTQNSVSINSAVILSRAVPAVTWMPARRRTLLNFSNTYGRITSPTSPTVKTSILHGGLEEDEYITPRFYFLQQAMFDHNFSQGLDLQQLYGIGAGYTLIKDPIQELDVTGVIDYTKQSFASGVSNNIIGSSFGDNYIRKFGKKIVFTQLAAFNPAWNHPSAYSANFAAGATFALYKNFGWSVGMADSYLNNPPAGFKGNSVQFTTGLTYAIQ